MLILGVDPGSKITACGLIDSSTKHSFWEIKKINNRLKQTDKIFEVFEFILKVIEKYKPEELAVESPFHSVNIKSAMILSEIKAAVIVAAKFKNINVYQYSPREVKQAICGYGAADKNQIKFVVEKTLKVSLKDELLDVSDALALALTHIYTHNL
ncbi:crossover junction endodeoxyribonuclease RuvC [Hippea alviniae]|uniref:crossover junction endodeoxyribonuclease RuvC n=1 Tax=Hippea alviniae TaxID=1279027 RepID=UPI0003B6A968|nr:crossover junction endodeoxyribonuclease RuvC [Hippea alviniae]